MIEVAILVKLSRNTKLDAPSFLANLPHPLRVLRRLDVLWHLPNDGAVG